MINQESQIVFDTPMAQNQQQQADALAPKMMRSQLSKAKLAPLVSTNSSAVQTKQP